MVIADAKREGDKTKSKNFRLDEINQYAQVSFLALAMCNKVIFYEYIS